MTASLSGVFNTQCFTDTGAPAAGYRLYTYAPGTTTQKVAFTDEAGAIPHTYTSDGIGGQYIALNARGELPAPLFLTSGGYDIALKTSAGATVWTRRALSSGDASDSLTLDLANGASPTKGAGLSAFNASLPYAVGTVGWALAQSEWNVKWFGLKGDGVTDDYAALIAADTLAATFGKNLFFPNGSYLVSAIIDKKPGVKWRGAGRRKAYPGVFTPGTNTLPTIVPTHTGRCAIRVQSTVLDSLSGMLFEDLNFTPGGLAGSAGPTSCFGFVCGDGKFQRDFTLYRCGIHDFTSAIDVYKSGAGTAIEMGVIKVTNCAISRNLWIARTLDGTQWNSFVFRDNEAGQNGYDTGGGIDIMGFAVVIEGNILEGQRNPVRLAGSYRGLSVRGNYFENNVGRAHIELKDVRGDWEVGPNNYSGVNFSKIDHTVLLGTSCGPGSCLDPYWPELVHKTPLALLGADAATGDNVLNPTVNYQYGRVDRVVGQNFSQLPQLLASARQAVTIARREINPQTGMPMPVQEYTTTGTGVVTLPYTIAGSSGQWLVACWLVKQEIDGSASTDPYVRLNVNGSSSGGTRDIPISRFGTYWAQGEWALITIATKLTSTMTSASIELYPHGVNPSAGRLSRFLRPFVYTTDSPNKILPYIDNYIAQSAVTAPTVGDWQRGDMLYNSAVTTAGQGLFVCTASGTPGTWGFN